MCRLQPAISLWLRVVWTKFFVRLIALITRIYHLNFCGYRPNQKFFRQTQSFFHGNWTHKYSLFWFEIWFEFQCFKTCVFVTWVFVFERSKNFVLVYTTYHVCLQASWRSYLLAGENGKVIPYFKNILQWQAWGGGDFWFWCSLKRGLHSVKVGASNSAFMWLECLAVRGA